MSTTLCKGQSLSEKSKQVAFLTLSRLLESTEVKLCPLEMAEPPWWESWGSMIPLQIAALLKVGGPFPMTQITLVEEKQNANKASSLLSSMASSSLWMFLKVIDFFSYNHYSAKSCFYTFGKLWVLNHNRNNPYTIHFSKQNTLETRSGCFTIKTSNLRLIDDS